MDNFFRRALDFIRREKIYIFLLVIAIFLHLSFSLLNQSLKDTGLGKAFEKRHLEDEVLISEEKIAEIISSNAGVYFLFLLLFAVFIFFAMVGLAFDVLYLYRAHKKAIPINRTQLIEPAKWNYWDIGKVVIIFFFANNIIWVFDIFFLAAIPYLRMRQNLRLMLSTSIVDLISIGAVFYFVMGERRQRISILGLTRERLLENFRYGIFAYIGLVPIMALVMYLTMLIFTKLDIPIEPQPVLLILKDEKHIPSLIFMGIFTAFFGPILEEIFFRGFAYAVFKKSLGIFWGISLSALIFAYIHANLASFFPIFCLGLLLAYIYEKTGSLIPSISVHIIHNSITLTFLLFLKVLSG